MINAEEFVLELNSHGGDKQNFKLGTVYDLFDNNTAQIQFDGEDTPSEKQYAYLASYTPKIFDRVLLAITGGTYVILGKIHYNIPPATGEELDRYLFDQKLVTMTKGLTVIGATTTLNSGATIVGNVGINGNINAVGISATGDVSGANINTPGTLTVGGGGTIKEVLTMEKGFTCPAGFWSQVSSLRILSGLAHQGASIGFFGTTPVTKTGLNPFPSPSSTTLLQAVTGINNVVNALKSYGLL